MQLRSLCSLPQRVNVLHVCTAWGYCMWILYTREQGIIKENVPYKRLNIEYTVRHTNGNMIAGSLQPTYAQDDRNT